jgi:hypothetical protein
MKYYIVSTMLLSVACHRPAAEKIDNGGKVFASWGYDNWQCLEYSRGPEHMHRLIADPRREDPEEPKNDAAAGAQASPVESHEVYAILEFGNSLLYRLCEAVRNGDIPQKEYAAHFKMLIDEVKKAMAKASEATLYRQRLSASSLLLANTQDRIAAASRFVQESETLSNERYEDLLRVAKAADGGSVPTECPSCESLQSCKNAPVEEKRKQYCAAHTKVQVAKETRKKIEEEQLEIFKTFWEVSASKKGVQ